MNVKFVQDTSKFWYKPEISREQGESSIFQTDCFELLRVKGSNIAMIHLIVYSSFICFALRFILFVSSHSLHLTNESCSPHFGFLCLFPSLPHSFQSLSSSSCCFFFSLSASLFSSSPHPSAINLLKDREPGAFVIRDSHSFRGAYGLAMKVACPPPTVQQNKKGNNKNGLR